MTKINSWRRVVTWGYREPDWTIVEEVQYIPDVVDTVVANNTTTDNTQSTKSGTKIFSPMEEFQLQAEGYNALWDNAMSRVYWDMANDLGQYSSYANTTLWAYDSLLKFISWNEAKLQKAAWKLYGELAGDIRDQKDYVYNMFGPNWTLTKEVNTYYDDLWNYLSTDAWRQAAKIAAQWMHSWASLWAIRAQQNEAYNQSFARYVQAKEQEINAKQQIATNLINFMSTLRREYWDTTNQYIIEMYKRANDLYNTVASSAMTDLSNYNKLRLSWGWWGSSSSLSSVWLDPRDNKETSEDDDSKNPGGWMTKTEAEAQLWQATPWGEAWSKASNTDWLHRAQYAIPWWNWVVAAGDIENLIRWNKNNG